MAKAFKSWLSYGQFERAVQTDRFIQSPETAAFLEAVLATSTSRQEILRRGFPLWRAQPGHDRPQTIRRRGEVVGELTFALPEQRMKPTLEFASEGRANPKGVLVLYLATHKKTAMSEVAHWSGPEISVAGFKTKRRLRLINFTNDKRPTRITSGAEPSPKMRERFVWAAINGAFSRPVSRSDTSADYVPTQVLTELFRKNGYDGIAYKSSLGSCHEGHNVVLFDLAAVTFFCCIPFQVKQASFEFNESGPAYWKARMSARRNYRRKRKS